MPRRGPKLKQGSPTVQRQRELARLRVQRFRERQRQQQPIRLSTAQLRQSEDITTQGITRDNVTENFAEAYIPGVTIPLDPEQEDLRRRIHITASTTLPGRALLPTPPPPSFSSLSTTSSHSAAARALVSLSTATLTRHKRPASQDLVQDQPGLPIDDNTFFWDPEDQPGPSGPRAPTLSRSSSPDEFLDAVGTQTVHTILEREQEEGQEEGQEHGQEEEQEPELQPEIPTHTQIQEEAEQDSSSDDNEGLYISDSDNTPQDEDQDDRQPARDALTDKLFTHLIHGLQGCSVTSHNEAHIEHTAATTEHHRLKHAVPYSSFPQVLQNDRILNNQELGQYDLPSPSQWEAAFCGTSSTNDEPPAICLHTEAEVAKPLPAEVSYDIDSYLGFASSLAFAGQGILFQPAPQAKQNITQDIHIETTTYQPVPTAEGIEQPIPTELRHTPHFQLGRAAGTQGLSIYILFPHIAHDRGKLFTALTERASSVWYNKIFGPALHNRYPAHFTQHLPSSFQHARQNAGARQTEDRLSSSRGYETLQSISFHLPAYGLADLWTDILQQIASSPRYHPFSEPQIFFCAKGTKLQFKSTPTEPTLGQTMKNFQTATEDVLNFNYVDTERFYIDIGKETCRPTSHLLSQGAPGTTDEAQVYLFKRCCLREHLQWMYNGHPPSDKSDAQRFYNMSLLRDACNLTSVTPKKSDLYLGGLLYSQYYTSVKEIWDANKSVPFNNPGIPQLALDPDLQRGSQYITGGQQRDLYVIKKAYIRSKQRTFEGLQRSTHKSFGCREEHRVTWLAFLLLQERIESELPNAAPPSTITQPTYVWVIKTSTFLSYLRRSVNKYAAAFEIIRAQCIPRHVTWEETKIMMVFLHTLRFILGGHQLSRESALWWNHREIPGRNNRPQQYYGLGFSCTLPQYGYCWLQPRFNWGTLRFLPDITDHTLFSNHLLKQQYLHRGGSVLAFFDTAEQMDAAVAWLNLYHQNQRVRDRLIAWMIQLCLQQFRINVMSSIRMEVRGEHLVEALLGHHAFTHEYLSTIMQDGLYLVSGNKFAYKKPAALCSFLFDFNDGKRRAHWDTRPYRLLYQRCVIALGNLPPALAPNFSILPTFHRRFLRSLLSTHWILPIPSANAWHQTTKQGERMWCSYAPRPGTTPETALSPTDWVWAEKNWHESASPQIPRWLSWSRERWQTWINGQLTTAAAAQPTT